MASQSQTTRTVQKEDQTMKSLPKFKTPEEAALFWENHEILDYVDANEFKVWSSTEIKNHLKSFARPKGPKQVFLTVPLDQKILDKALRQSKQQQTPLDKIIGHWIKKGASA